MVEACPLTSTPSILNRLKEKWSIRETEYGRVIIIPRRHWPSLPMDWQEEAEREGAKVFQNSWDGEPAFFVKVPDEGKPNSAFPKKWSHSEIQQLKEFLSAGLGPAEIGTKLGRSRYSVLGKINRLGLNNPRTNSTPEPTGNVGDDVVKEFLACVSELYPRYPNACAHLLREAGRKILGGKVVG